jgi:hypothetical protein
MLCAGNCFNVDLLGRLELPSTFNEPDEEGWAEFIAGITETYNYTPLKPWETRIPRLHPSQGLTPLSADLLVATVSDTEVVIVQTGETVNYTALSYTWGYLQLSETLICNGKKKNRVRAATRPL